MKCRYGNGACTNMATRELLTEFQGGVRALLCEGCAEKAALDLVAIPGLTVVTFPIVKAFSIGAEALARCPIKSILASHWNEDGTCECRRLRLVGP